LAAGLDRHGRRGEAAGDGGQFNAAVQAEARVRPAVVEEAGHAQGRVLGEVHGDGDNAAVRLHGDGLGRAEGHAEARGRGQAVGAEGRVGAAVGQEVPHLEVGGHTSTGGGKSGAADEDAAVGLEDERVHAADVREGPAARAERVVETPVRVVPCQETVVALDLAADEDLAVRLHGDGVGGAGLPLRVDDHAVDAEGAGE